MLSSQTRVYPRTPIVQEVSTQAEVASGRFKVVIAYYQREPGILRRAVRSALEQRVEELEVIVVDDESPVPAETELAGRPAVQARISGRGWIHGIHQISLDPSDPYPEGYLLSDCWGEAFDLLG